MACAFANLAKIIAIVLYSSSQQSAMVTIAIDIWTNGPVMCC